MPRLFCCLVQPQYAGAGAGSRGAYKLQEGRRVECAEGGGRLPAVTGEEQNYLSAQLERDPLRKRIGAVEAQHAMAAILLVGLAKLLYRDGNVAPILPIDSLCKGFARPGVSRFA